jgi:LemA protein
METMQNSSSSMPQMPQIKFKAWWVVVGLLVLVVVWALSGYNGLVGGRENVRGTRSKVQSAYQERSDLVPNLVNTVKGAANFEQSTLTGVVEARAKATSVTLSADNAQEFQQAQAGLSSALSRLLAVSEAYPTLQATQSFRDLQVQLEGIENRIRTERNRYNDSVKDYNGSVQRFPNNISAMIYGFKQESYFEAAAGSDKAPTVDFGTSSSSTTK